MVYIEPCNSLSRKRPCSKSIPKNAMVSLLAATQPLRKDKGSSLHPLLLWQFTAPLELPLYSGRWGSKEARHVGARKALTVWTHLHQRQRDLFRHKAYSRNFLQWGQNRHTCQRPRAQALRKGLLQGQKPRAASSLLISTLNKPRSL